MDARELIREGRLSDARSRLTESVKANPGDSGSRTMLFQVLAYAGEWDKARRHLEVLAGQDSGRAGGVSVCLELVQAETERLQVMDLKTPPSFLPREPDFADGLRTVLQDLYQGSFESARQHVEAIDAACPRIAGTLNGNAFEGVRDVDARFAHVLEAFIHGRYVWIAFADIRELALPRPKNLLDLLWMQAQVTTWEGLTANAHLPVLYPASFRHADDAVKLGRVTEWESMGAGLIRGIGQHVFEFGDREVGLLEIQEANFIPSGSEDNP
ncbi:MAG TPA: type VI secretion system accessory protein TagJ [Desulfobacterales bacterium]